MFGRRKADKRIKNVPAGRGMGTVTESPEANAVNDSQPLEPFTDPDGAAKNEYSSELLREPWNAGPAPEAELAAAQADFALALEADRRRQKKSRRRKRRRRFFLLLNLFILAFVALFVVEKMPVSFGEFFPDVVEELIPDSFGELLSGGAAEYGNRDYSIYRDDREDFKTAIDGSKIPGHGNDQRYIAIHFLGVEGENHRLEENGVGTHFYIYYDGTIYQAADLDAVTWHVGTNGYYTQLHPYARNSNTIGIELCVHCDGDPTDDHCGQWYFTEETQRAAVKLVRYLMRELDIPADHVLRHGDIVNKWCPAPYLENNNYGTSWTWDEFLAEVRDLPEDEIPDYPVVKKP